MEEIGYVKSINGDYALIAFQKKSGCGGNCASCKAGCVSNLVTVEVKNTLSASKGDKVKVKMESKSFYYLVFWVYILPSIMTILGTILGISLFEKYGYENYELLGALVGFILLAISFYISSRIDKKRRKNNQEDLKMVKILK